MAKAILLSPFTPLALMVGFPLIWPMIYWSPDSWGDFLFGAFATVMFFPFVYAYSVFVYFVVATVWAMVVFPLHNLNPYIVENPLMTWLWGTALISTIAVPFGGPVVLNLVF